MATALQHTGEMRKTPGEPCTWATRESVERAVRNARRTATGARAAAEDFVAGCALGVAAAWLWRRRT